VALRERKRLKNEYQYDDVDDEKKLSEKKEIGTTHRKKIFSSFVDSKQKKVKEEFHVEMLRATLFILHI